MDQARLKSILAKELHKPARVHYIRRKYIMKGIDDTWQIDLVEMHSFSKINKGFNYILTVVDTFSKYGFAEPVKNKSGHDVTRAFEKILINSNRVPKNCQSDQGKEFYNATFQNLMTKYKINHYSSYSNLKASLVERFNRTLKDIMYRQFTKQGNYKWLDLLPRILAFYNNKRHRTIDMKPVDVKKENETELLESVYKSRHQERITPKFQAGDVVRISRQRTVFSRGFKQSWSNELFTIRKVQLTRPPTYLLKDYQGTSVLGSFYEPELQKTKLPDTYFVEKVIKRSGNKVLVKWLGFDSTHNSWIKSTEVAQ
jgi:Integrase core domain